jgi:hypothetical protein
MLWLNPVCVPDVPAENGDEDFIPVTATATAKNEQGLEKVKEAFPAVPAGKEKTDTEPTEGATSAVTPLATGVPTVGVPPNGGSHLKIITKVLSFAKLFDGLRGKSQPPKEVALPSEVFEFAQSNSMPIIKSKLMW